MTGAEIVLRCQIQQIYGPERGRCILDWTFLVEVMNVHLIIVLYIMYILFPFYTYWGKLSVINMDEKGIKIVIAVVFSLRNI